MAGAGIGLALTLASTAVSAIGTIAAGNANSAMATYQAQVDKLNAQEEKAAGQREGMQYARQAKLALGKLRTNAAASGLGASDPTVLNLAGDIGAYGTLQQQLAEYGGNSRAAGLREAATLKLAEASADKTGGYLGAAGTILGGLTDKSMFGLYAGGGFGSPDTGSAPYGAASGWA